MVEGIAILAIISLAFLVRLLTGSRSEASHSETPGNPPEAEPHGLLKVKVGYIFDGDTVEVLDSDTKIRVRLYAIDCPEGDQPWGDRATGALKGMIGGRRYVYLERHGTDCYGRTLATLYKGEGSELTNVNERMVVCGHAWVVRKYYDQLPEDRQNKLDKLQSWAEDKRVGLWKSDNPIPPWEWRRGWEKSA